MKHFRPTLSSNRGSSLISVIFGMVIISVVLLAMSNAQASALQSHTSFNDNLKSEHLRHFFRVQIDCKRTAPHISDQCPRGQAIAVYIKNKKTSSWSGPNTSSTYKFLCTGTDKDFNIVDVKTMKPLFNVPRSCE